MYDPSATPEKFANTLIEALLLTKSNDWQYEREYRLILPLDDLALFPHRIHERNHLFSLPAEAVTGVILGSRSSEETRVAVKRTLATNPHMSHVRLYEAQTSDTRFEVSIQSLDLS
jgi:hypothetical protein